MISVAFIQGEKQDLFDNPYTTYESFSDTWMESVSDIFSVHEMEMADVMLESEITGTISDENKVVYEEANESLFKKIGDKIIEIYEKIKALMEQIMERIKSIRFKGKSDAQKLDLMIKKHPEFKDEVIASFKKGYLDFSDMKTLQEMDKAYDELLKLAKQKDIDPNTFKGKVEKVKKAIENVDKSKVVKVAGAITVTITAIVSIVTFKSKIVEADARNKKNKAEIERLKTEAYETLTKEGAITKNSGYWQTILALHREVNGKHVASQKQDEDVIQRLASKIASGLDVINGHVKVKSTTQLHGDLSKNIDRQTTKAAEELQKKLDETRAVEEIKASFKKPVK